MGFSCATQPVVAGVIRKWPLLAMSQQLRATMRRPSISAASPGHSISGSDHGSSALIKVCYHGATSPLVRCALLQPHNRESGRFLGFLLVLTGNMSDQVITVRCGIFLAAPAGTKVQPRRTPFEIMDYRHRWDG